MFARVVPSCGWQKNWLEVTRALRARGRALTAPALAAGGGMLALVMLFFVLVMGSALAVVHTAYSHRVLFNELQDARQSRDRLQVEWGKLLLEESALGAHGRIEQAVTGPPLEMQAPKANRILVVRP